MSDLVDPDMPAEDLRLHMGELHSRELPIVRAAIRWANSAAQARIEAVRRETVEAVAREWLASYDDARNPDYAFADRMLGNDGMHSGDCSKAAIPAPFACSACFVDDARAFAIRALTEAKEDK